MAIYLFLRTKISLVHLENLLVCLTKLQIAQHLEVAAMILIFYNQNILEDTATSQLLTIT
jgi:hypothetical protein